QLRSRSFPTRRSSDLILIYDANSQLNQHYSFTYNNSPTERLFLEQFIRHGINLKNSKMVYEFDYNPLSLPAYNSLEVDQWGYYRSEEHTSELQSRENL